MDPKKSAICMNLKKGEIWTCLEPYCGAEIEVLRSAKNSCPGDFTVRCCCGKEMTLKTPALKEATRELVGAASKAKR